LLYRGSASSNKQAGQRFLITLLNPLPDLLVPLPKESDGSDRELNLRIAGKPADNQEDTRQNPWPCIQGNAAAAAADGRFEKFRSRANFKTFQFGRGQGGRKFQPQEYTEYFEDLILTPTQRSAKMGRFETGSQN